MQFEVPGGTSLVFSGPDGELLATPMTAPIPRVIGAE